MIAGHLVWPTDRLTDNRLHSSPCARNALRLNFKFNRIYKFYLCDMGAFRTVGWNFARSLSISVTIHRSQMVHVNP